MREKNNLEQWLYNHSVWFWVVFFGLIFLFMICGCKSTTQVVEKVVVKTQTDTFYHWHIDTIIATEYVHDSIDRYIIDSTWMDSIGMMHNKRYERINRMLTDKSKEYESQVAAKAVLQHELDSLSNQREEVIIQEKKVYVWWPLVIIASFVAILLLLRFKK